MIFASVISNAGGAARAATSSQNVNGPGPTDDTVIFFCLVPIILVLFFGTISLLYQWWTGKLTSSDH